MTCPSCHSTDGTSDHYWLRYMSLRVVPRSSQSHLVIYSQQYAWHSTSIGIDRQPWMNFGPDFPETSKDWNSNIHFKSFSNHKYDIRYSSHNIELKGFMFWGLHFARLLFVHFVLIQHPKNTIHRNSSLKLQWYLGAMRHHGQCTSYFGEETERTAAEVRQGRWMTVSFLPF